MKRSLLAVAVSCGCLFTTGLHATPLDQWTLCSSPVRNHLLGVGFGSNRFIAVGGYGVILVSSDGTNWNTRASTTSNELKCIAYGGGVFAAAGAGVVVISTNTVAWRALYRRASASLSPNPPYFYGISYGVNFGVDRFVAVGDNGEVQWTDPFPIFMGWSTRLSLSGITYGNGQFMAVGEVPGAQAVIAKIVVPPGWAPFTYGHSLAGKSLRGIAYGTNEFVAVGLDGRTLTSPDGIAITNQNSGVSEDLSAITYGGNLFVAVGGAGTVVSSPDGVVWTSHNSGATNNLNGVAYGNGYFVAVGDDGTILRSGFTPPTSPPDKIKISGLSVATGALFLRFTSSRDDSASDFKVLTATQPTGPYLDTGARVTGNSGVFQAGVPAGGVSRFYRVQK